MKFIIITQTQIKKMITLPNQSNFVVKSQKFQGSLMYRSFQGALNMILRSLINDQNRYSIVSNIMSEYALTDDPAVCMKLDEESYKMLTEIRAWMKFIKFGFIEITSQIRKYHKYEDPRLMEYLIDAQDRINYASIKEDFERQLIQMKESHGWTVEFIAEWMEKSMDMKDNNIDLFAQKKEPKFKQPQVKTAKTLKRSSPAVNKHSDQVETQAGEQPVKKLKKESINYNVIYVACQSIIKHSPSDEIKSSRQALFANFKLSQNIQYMQSLDKAAAKQLYELRSYVKHFMEAFMEVTCRVENKKFDDGQMVNRVLKAQPHVNPENILESYRTLMRQNQLGMNLSTEVMEEIIAKMISMKKAETQMLLEKKRSV